MNALPFPGLMSRLLSFTSLWQRFPIYHLKIYFFRTRITYMLKLCTACVFHLLVLGCYFLKLEYGQKTLVEPYFLSFFSSISVLADSNTEMKCTYWW